MQADTMKESLISIHDKEKWWMSDISKCSSTDEHQIWVHTLETFLKTTQWLKNNDTDVW